MPRRRFGHAARRGAVRVDGAGGAGSELVGVVSAPQPSLGAHERPARGRPSEPDARGAGDGDPQQLARLTLVGKAIELSDGSAEEDSAKAVYLAKFPQMAALVDQLGDFSFWVFRPETARFVGGFARAFTLTPEALRREIAEGAEKGH